MNRFKTLQIAFAALFSTGVFAETCNTLPKEEYYRGNPVDVAVGEQWTRLVLPEEGLIGIDPVVKTGIEVDQVNPSLPNRVVVRVSDPNYSGILFVYGESGREYVFNLNAAGCADTQVKLRNPVVSNEALQARAELDNRTQKTLNSYMYRYLMSDRQMPLPDGFRSEMVQGDESDRLVMQVGTLDFTVEEIWHGTDLTGMFLKVENRGRTALKVDIQAIDYSRESIVNAFGRVDKIAMVPINRILAPAPEYLNDVYDANPSYGFLFVVTERDDSNG